MAIRRICRPAFTMVEVIVVIAIAAVVMGLVIPAILMAREAVHRVACGDNLRQIGAALHAYHGTFNSFPAGAEFQGRKSPYPLLGWQARLLPYIDQQPLWKATEQAFKQTKRFNRNPPH